MATAPMTPPWLLAFARVFLGCTFLFSDHGNASSDELLGFLNGALKTGFQWYRPIVSAVLIPHAHTFGTLIVICEVTIGILLIVGLATRASSIVAIILLANYESAKGSLPWQPGIDQSDIVLALIIFASAAGRVYGLDGLVHRRFSKAVAS